MREFNVSSRRRLKAAGVWICCSSTGMHPLRPLLFMGFSHLVLGIPSSICLFFLFNSMLLGGRRILSLKPRTGRSSAIYRLCGRTYTRSPCEGGRLKYVFIHTEDPGYCFIPAPIPTLRHWRLTFPKFSRALRSLRRDASAIRRKAYAPATCHSPRS